MNNQITFLFTDIEGSTKLAQDFRDLYQTALQDHDLVLNEVIGENNGLVFKKIGDAFCASFKNAQDAVNAAVEIQKKLSEKNKDIVGIKVRIGIHSGEAEFINGDYSGYITLSKVQRVMSIASGGQILTTQEVFDSVKNADENKYLFKDFGNRKLKDILIPVHIYQIIADDIPLDFPPIKSLDVRWHNLPLELTNFIGREKEILEIKKLLTQSRLLSMIGFGGTGKTRLSVHTGSGVIDEFTNGVCFTPLAQLSEPAYVLQEIAAALKITADEKRKTIDVIVDFLREKELLLILDNCEHLIAECAKITEILLQKCPKLKIIATSRESLHIFGETVYHVPSLSLPDLDKNLNIKSLVQFESVKLFIDRALAVKQDFELTEANAKAVAQLCHHLDGIPLAIELAAARVKVLSVDKILERLKDRFSLLTGGKRTQLPRQQTLKALIDWSYDLLSDKEKLLCQRLSLFSGGWTLDAAEKICSDEILDEFEILDLLSNLSDKSLVKVTETENNLRYAMLESIRKYGDEKLIESGKKSELQEKHFNFFYKFAEHSETRLTGKDQREWLMKIAAENENIRDNLKWSLTYNPDLSMQMSVVLGKFWELRSHFSEGLDFLRKSLESSKYPELIWKAKAIYWIGFFLIHHGKYDESKKYLNQALENFRELKNTEGEAVTLTSLATIALFEGEYENLNLYSNKSLMLSYEIGNKSYIARNLQNIALALMQQGKHGDARIKIDESLTVYREINDTLQLAKIIGNIGALEYLMCNYEKAREAFEESLQLRRELGDREGISIALNNLGSVAYMIKDFEKSVIYLEEALEIIREIGDRRIYVTAVGTLGSIANDKGDYPKAVKMYTESIVISKELGDKYSMAKGIEGFATILVIQKKFKEACLLAAKYISLLESSNKNIIEGELTRIEDIKATLKSNLSESDFEKYWTEGEAMTVEDALLIMSNEVSRLTIDHLD